MDMNRLLAVVLILTALVSTVPVRSEEAAQGLPDITEFKTYDEITDRLPLADALRLLVNRARSGDCHAAGYLAFYLQAQGMTDLEGHDDHYWLLFAARCGHVPSMIEVGYPKKYTTRTTVPCGATRLEIVTHCEPLTRETGFPVCRRQVFSFFDGNNRLLRKHTAINRPVGREDRVIASDVSCLSDRGIDYYVVGSSNFGGSCCDWSDVFDNKGKYLGSTDMRTTFQVRLKSVPRNLGDQLFGHYRNWDLLEVDIESYPKFE
jgi:hypothetical protein